MQKCAEAAWKSLNGVICVYKPSHSSCSYVKNSIISNLCNDLNALQTRPVQNYLEINHTNSDISIKVRPSYADNTLCVGPRYQPEDFEVHFTSFLSTLSSGVLGINEGQFLAKKIAKFCQPKCYQVKGILGIATEKFYIDDRVIARAKYHRVTKCLIDKLVASYQASYQNRLFQECNVNPQSQEAYELATSDKLLPNETKSPAILGLKCIEFKPPEFTLGEAKGLKI
ncbi:hypothetical protein RUM44_013067 [Polyplax serrata]|uniref:Pseudouridine synthase II N-terminal domain-containing protein n=1 Tax=Polyplax serrata TaxID=468196 RepID=A0ABR1BD35_POLSC